LDGIGFAPAISDFCARARSLHGTPWQRPDAFNAATTRTCAVVAVNLTVPCSWGALDGAVVYLDAVTTDRAEVRHDHGGHE
jgi:hypothetical protein